MWIWDTKLNTHLVICVHVKGKEDSKCIEKEKQV